MLISRRFPQKGIQWWCWGRVVVCTTKGRTCVYLWVWLCECECCCRLKRLPNVDPY